MNYLQFTVGNTVPNSTVEIKRTVIAVYSNYKHQPHFGTKPSWSSASKIDTELSRVVMKVYIQSYNDCSMAFTVSIY